MTWGQALQALRHSRDLQGEDHSYLQSLNVHVHASLSR